MIQPPDYASYIPGSRCNSCGTKFAEQKLYPRICFHCGLITYKNPIPVVVPIIPVPQPGSSIYDRKNPCKWLIHQRNIDPKKGEWALPSGYINFGEEWNQAAARELEEEVGLVTKPEDFSILDVGNATNGNMLIFCVHNDGVKEEAIQFTPNSEVSDIQLITDPYQVELCFPTHNVQLRKYYDSLDW
jgi:8-oxo-dGTP diphosphatase